jgi:hypothetical protein
MSAIVRQHLAATASGGALGPITGFANNTGLYSW